MIGAHAFGGLPQRDASRLRQEIPRRVLGAEPRLDGVAVKAHFDSCRVNRSPIAMRSCHSTRSIR